MGSLLPSGKYAGLSKDWKRTACVQLAWRKQEKNQIKPTSLSAPGFCFLACICQKVHLKLKYFSVQETADYPSNHEVNQVKLWQASNRQTLPWLANGKIHLVHSTKNGKYSKKKKKLYSILHRISSIWACFGSCYHTELPWYLGRFIKMVTKDGRNVKPCRVSHLPLRNTPLCGQNAAPLQHYICGRMVGHQS